MRAGLKRYVVQLQAKTVSRDGVGQPIETWTPVGTLRAQRMAGPKVAERFAANQTFATVTVVYRVGYWPTFDTVKPDTHRIVHKGVTYDIQGVQEIGAHEGVELLCSARGE